MPKSYKREVGAALLGFCGVLSIVYFAAGLTGLADEKAVEALSTPFSVIIFGCLGWSAGAYGMHSLATQWVNR